MSNRSITARNFAVVQSMIESKRQIDEIDASGSLDDPCHENNLMINRRGQDHDPRPGSDIPGPPESC
jgi:hypothetical protein